MYVLFTGSNCPIFRTFKLQENSNCPIIWTIFDSFSLRQFCGKCGPPARKAARRQGLCTVYPPPFSSNKKTKKKGGEGFREKPVRVKRKWFQAILLTLKAIFIPKDETLRNNYLLVKNLLTIQKFFDIIFIEKLKLFYKRLNT